MSRVTLPLFVTPTVTEADGTTVTLPEAAFYSALDAGSAILSLSLMVAIDGGDVTYDAECYGDNGAHRVSVEEILTAADAEWDATNG